MTTPYFIQYQESIDSSDRFWLTQATQLPWYSVPKTGCRQDKDGLHHWFPDGELNTAYMALDYHVENGRGQQLALIYDSPVTQTKQQFTYQELKEAVARFAAGLQRLGVVKGDRVVIYMPMVPEAVIGMLACARLGAIHSVVFGGFAPHELSVRIDDAKPKVILSASCGIEIERIIAYKPMLDEALEKANHKVEHCVVLQRSALKAKMNMPRDIDWQTLSNHSLEAKPVKLNACDPLYVLYTSGTTGKPKGVLRENGGHAVALNYSMSTVYGMSPGDVFFAASDIGWVVGHSYIVYGPLLFGCTTVLYEGKPIRTPDASAFWRIVEEYNVNALFTAPTAFRAIKKEDPTGLGFKKYDTSSLKTLFLAGERLDPATYEWLLETTGLPVIDHWWQTETGWAIASNPVGLEKFVTKPGSATKCTPGYDVQILDAAGEKLGVNEQGAVCIKLPLPPGCLTTLWQDTPRFKQSYLSAYPGYYLTGDGGYFDEDGYLFIMGRTDDVINVAGHRLSTGEMEEIVSNHPDVAECAVFAAKCELKGQTPVAMIVLKDGISHSHTEIEAEVVAQIRNQIGAIACLKRVLTVPRLPKTRSGKILRKNLRQLVDGDPLQIPSTIDDASVFNEIDKLWQG
ncbi:Acetyl-coenzyme A synthetase [Pseudoalteromonas luteoviolacea B = ATCC 29581]|nr:Acetyl-coenzyme A synthetase [Pseudoalteromonas luteoviolacea B = ATCC 29581]